MLRNGTILFLIMIFFFNCEKNEIGSSEEKLPKTIIINKEKDIFSGFPSFEISKGVFKTRFFTRTNSSHIDPLGGEKIKYSLDQGNNWFFKSEKNVEGIKGFRKPFFNVYPIGWSYVDKSKKDSLINEGLTVLDLDTKSDLVAYLSPNLIKVKFVFNGVEVIDTIKGPDYMSGIIGLPNFTGHLKKDNTLLMAVYGIRKGSGFYEPLIVRSVDGGDNWSFIPVLNKVPTSIGFDEVAIVTNSKGAIIAMMRSSNNDYLYRSVSNDNGLTWSDPEKTNIWGYPASIIKLKSDVLLCTYGFRKEPIGIRASFSYDDGLTWDVGNEIILREDGFEHGANTGYPESIEYENGKIATVYYITDTTNITSVELTKWKIK